MGTAPLTAIHPALNELFRAAEGDLCATFTVPECPLIWVQVRQGSISAAYPHTEEPCALLRNANAPSLPGFAVDRWEPRRFATFTHESGESETVARFIDSLLVAFHELEPENYPVKVEFERF